MRLVSRLMIGGLVATFAAVPALAWGPTTQVSIVTGAARLLGKSEAIPLPNLIDDIRDGAEVSAATLSTLIPGSDTNPIGAIEDEMLLLQAVRSTRVDPYFAYRLGVLGKLVAQVTAPLAEADPTYRTRYYEDVDRAGNRSELEAKPRREVQPRGYFSGLRAELEPRDALILSQYRDGTGFQGVASLGLGSDLSRSVNAVADVWHTVLNRNISLASLSKDRLRSYYTEALRFYLQRGNLREADSTYKRLGEMDVDSADLKKQVADMYYDAGQYERAIEEYRKVLEEEPGRRDVIDRLTAYYVEQGDEALEEENLEDALEAYTEAANTDKLNEQAQQKMLETRRIIAAREERLAQARQTLDQALELEKQAEDHAADKELGEAIDLLQQASTLYSGVTDEFPEERRAAQAGYNSTQQRLEQLQTEMLADAQTLSGTGGSAALRAHVEAVAADLARQALQDLVRQQYQEKLEQMRQQANDELTGRQPAD